LGKHRLVTVDNPFHPFFLPNWYLLFTRDAKHRAY